MTHLSSSPSAREQALVRLVPSFSNPPTDHDDTMNHHYGYDDPTDELEQALRSSSGSISAPPNPSPSGRLDPRTISRRLVRRPRRADALDSPNHAIEADIMPTPPRVNYGRVLVQQLETMNHNILALADRLDEHGDRHPRDRDDCAPEPRPQSCNVCQPQPQPQPPRSQPVDCAPRKVDPCGEAVFLGVDSRLLGGGDPVGAGKTATFVLSTTTALQVSDFYVAADIAASFVISDIKVGRSSRLESGRLPASMFSSDASHRPPMRAFLPSGGEISIEVLNVSADAQHFTASFTGTDV